FRMRLSKDDAEAMANAEAIRTWVTALEEKRDALSAEAEEFWELADDLHPQLSAAIDAASALQTGEAENPDSAVAKDPATSLASEVTRLENAHAAAERDAVDRAVHVAALELQIEAARAGQPAGEFAEGRL